MFRLNFHIEPLALPGRSALIIVALVVGNLFFNIVANASFRYSVAGSSWRSFLSWQVLGNLAGFITVLTLTGLLRSLPLHIAYPVTTGLAVVGVQVVAARYLFHEAITPFQWIGTLLVVVGIVLISGR